MQKDQKTNKTNTQNNSNNSTTNNSNNSTTKKKEKTIKTNTGVQTDQNHTKCSNPKKPFEESKQSQHTSDSSEDMNNRVNQVKKAYNDLEVPQTHRKKFKKKVKKLQDNRKQMYNRDYTSSDVSDIEEEIFLHDKPMNIPSSMKFTLPGYVGDTKINFQIDCGSAASLINKSVFEQIDESLILKKIPIDKKYQDYGGNNIEILAKVTMQVKFENVRMEHTFLVANSEKASNLLGVDVIRSKRISIEVEDDCKIFLSFKKSGTNTRKRIAIQENKVLNLYATQTRDINFGVNYINATFDSELCEIANASELHNTVGIANSTLDPFPNEEFLTSLDTDGSICVPIHNKNLGSSVVFEGQLIGTFQPLSKEEIYNREIGITEFVGENMKIVPNLNNSIKYLEHKFNKINKEATKSTEQEQPETINKIKLTNNLNDSDSPPLSESDFADELFTKIRIPDSDKVWEKVLKDVPQHLRKRTFHMLTEKYPNVVSRHSTDFGHCNLENSEFPIDLTDDIPVTAKPYPLNSVYEQQLKEIVDDMVKNGLLIPESSNYCSGVFLRARPDSTNTGNHRVRVISDYRALNAKTVEDHFPIPNLKMILQKLNKKKYFIVLDLKDSYQSISIKKSDRHKASLVTSFGQYSPTKMGYGHRNAPAFFSRQIYRLLHDIDGAVSYLDDIVCFGETPEEALDNFERVIARLEKHGFRISLTKLQMFKSYLKFLGVMISKNGISCDPAKVQAVLDFPIPKSKTEMQRFLGLANYLSDFIPNFATTASPLYKLASGNKDKLTLTEEETLAFEKLKETVSKPTLLSFIDPDLEIYLESDASYSSYGGLAYQVKVYDEADIPKLKAQYEEMLEKSTEELNEEMRNIIEKYTNGETMPNYSPTENQTEKKQTEKTKKNDTHYSPYLNSPLKIKKRKGKVYVPQVNFYFSKKFTEVQQKSWSSLMKEASSILDILERRCDFLALAKETIILSDCSACIYLYQQSKSNSLLSRYLARLNQYNFKVLVKHKSGKALTAADALSRMYVLEDSEENQGRIDHRQGILVKVPFKIGTLVTPKDIISYLQSGEQQIVIPTSDPTISKCCQTDDNPQHVHSITENINQSKSTKSKIFKELTDLLSYENYAKKQQEEFKELYEKLLVQPVSDKKIENGLILTKYKNRFVRLTPNSLRNALLSRFHLLGHYSHRKLVKIITKTDIWPGINKDCEDFTSKCISCIFIRPGKKDTYKLGYPLTGHTGDVWMMDVVSGLPNSKGFSYFVSVIDTFSRFTITYPIRNDTSDEIVRKLEEQVFSVFGSPKVIITDGARNMGKSNKFQELCTIYKTEIKIRSPYSSRSLGLCERVHQSILNNLRSLSDSFRNSWVENLPLATALQNTVPHTATKLSPFELMFGRDNELWNPLTDINKFATSNPDVTQYHEDLQKHLKDLYVFAKEQDDKYKKKMREHYGGKSFQYKPGSFVLSQNKLPAVNEKLKTRPKFYGPFLVLENLETVVIAENVMNGRVSYLNKNLIKPIAEKSVEKYSNLPFHVKQIFGEGFTNEAWKDLNDENKLMDTIKRRNNSQAEFGIEHPLEKLVPFKEVVEAQDEIINELPHTSSSSEEDELAKNQLENSETQKEKSEKRVTFSDQVNFENNSPRRSPRTIRAPERLNL